MTRRCRQAGELTNMLCSVESHRRGPGTWGSQAFVFWTISLEGVWKCGRRMGITESRKTVHLSSICWAPSLCQTLWQGLRIPNGVQWKGEPLRTHSRGGDMNQCFNSILWLVWLQEGKGWLSLTREIYSPSPVCGAVQGHPISTELSSFSSLF